jgi:hypothetical protein
MIKVYPTKFEAYDDETKDSLFTVEAFDECVATVKVETTVNVELWDKISHEIRDCLIAMELEQ